MHQSRHTPRHTHTRIHAHATGRSWTPTELRAKSFQDLHALWFICCKERNKLLSQREEARRFSLHFPATPRLRQTHRTMRHVKLVVWERRGAWMQAQHVMRMERRREELEAEGASKRRVAETLEREFPLPLHQVGKALRKVRAENKRRVRQLGRRGRRQNSAWTIV